MISIPASPLPEIKNLFRAFLFPQNFYNLWSSDQDIFLYSRGAWALAEAIKALLSRRGKKEGVVWFPDYFCNGALVPVRRLPIKLHFYPICENIEPNWDVLEKKTKDMGTPDILVLVHYFGFANAIEKTRIFCKTHGVDLIEDAAHVLSPCCGIGESGSLTIYSPRKILALPEGGLLVAPREIGNYVKRPNRNILINKEVITWFMKRFVQKIMIKLRIPWHTVWHIRERQGSLMSDFLGLPNCSIITKKLLHAVGKELKRIVQKRRNNYNLLFKELVSNKIQPLFSSLPDCVCPYAFPVLVKEGRDLILKKLRSQGIPVSSWPDLPPEVLINRGEHKVAIWLQRHIVLFPVHQGVSRDQIEYLVKIYGDLLQKEVW